MHSDNRLVLTLFPKNNVLRYTSKKNTQLIKHLMGLPEETSKFCFKACFQFTGLDFAYKKMVLILHTKRWSWYWIQKEGLDIPCNGLHAKFIKCFKTRKRYVRAIIVLNMFWSTRFLAFYWKQNVLWLHWNTNANI